MTPQEYIDRALIFERSGMKPHERRIHAALGLGSELQEWLKAVCVDKSSVNAIEELGDLMWFAALAVDATGDLIAPPNNLAEQAVNFLIGDFITEVKREFAYGKAPDLISLNRLANQIFYSIAYAASNGGVDMDYRQRVLHGNLAKLHSRYKAGKFSIDEALHRDTLAEIEAMLSAT